MTLSSLNLGQYRYAPRGKLDETRMSTLWLADEAAAARMHDASSDAPVVTLKIARMTEEKFSYVNQRAIENEERWLTNLRHPNIVKLRPIVEEQYSGREIYRARSELPGRPWFLVTDYLPGGDLNHLLSERGRLPATLALEIANHLAETLAFIHANGCVHCDIKSRNVLFRQKPAGYALTDETEPILIDFGIAKNPTEGAQRVTGTPLWMPPEAESARRSGRKLVPLANWDVYALALILYNMASGKRPKIGEPSRHSWDRFTATDLAEDPTVIDAEGLAAGLNQLLSRSISDEPDERVSAAAFAEETRRLLELTRVPAAVPAVTPPPRQTGRGWLWGLGGLAAAGALAGLLLFGPFGGAGDGSDSAGPAVADRPPGLELPGGGADATDTPAAPTAAPAVAETEPAVIADQPEEEEPPPTATSKPPTATATSEPTNEPVIAPTREATRMAEPTPTARPTSTPLRVTATSTRVMTRTPTPRPTRTPGPTPPAATPRPAQLTTADKRVALVLPPENTGARDRIEFAWRPEFDLGDNECFEVRFWEGEPNAWASGFGIHPHGKTTGMFVTFDETFERQFSSSQLRPDTRYNWGVLLVQCEPYKPIGLVSNVRHFTYNAP